MSLTALICLLLSLPYTSCTLSLHIHMWEDARGISLSDEAELFQIERASGCVAGGNIMEDDNLSTAIGKVYM